MSSEKEEIPDDGSGGEEEESPAAKRPRIETASSGLGKDASGSKGDSSVVATAAAGVSGSSESDEEFTLGSDESGEEAYSDSEGDSSDIEEEDADAEGENKGATTIVTGVQVELKKLEGGNFIILHKQSYKELKMLLPDNIFQSTVSTATEQQQKGLIPILEATNVEITKDDEIELIVYADELELAKDEHPFDDEKSQEPGEGGEIAFKENSWCLIKIEDVVDLFATQDFQQ